MPSLFAQDRDEKVRTTIDDFRMVDKVRAGIHHSEQLNDGLNPIKGAHGMAYRREELQTDLTRVSIGALDGTAFTNAADAQLSVLVPRALTGKKQQRTRTAPGYIACDRSGNVWECQSQLFQAFLRRQLSRCRSVDHVIPFATSVLVRDNAL